MATPVSKGSWASSTSSNSSGCQQLSEAARQHQHQQHQQHPAAAAAAAAAVVGLYLWHHHAASRGCAVACKRQGAADLTNLHPLPARTCMYAVVRGGVSPQLGPLLCLACSTQALPRLLTMDPLGPRPTCPRTCRPWPALRAQCSAMQSRW
jgi:hypothetical protein